MKRVSSSSYCMLILYGTTDGWNVGFFLLSIGWSVGEFSKGDLEASGYVVMPTAGVSDVYKFISLLQPELAVSAGESHVCECTSTWSARYLRANEAVSSSFASSFSMGIATGPPLR